MERIIGIDPGSRITGYGVIDADRGQLHFVACGVVKTTTKYPFSNRLNEIFEGINEVVQVHGPVVAAIEDVFLATNPRSALSSDMLGGQRLWRPCKTDWRFLTIVPGP